MTTVDRGPGGVDRELDELLGAYALHALDPDERDRVDRYLEHRLEARAEIDAHLETAARLALLSDDERAAPPSVWEAIRAEVHAPDGPSMASVTSLASRRTVSARLAGGVGAVAATVILVLGLQVADLRGRVGDSPRDALPGVDVQYAAAASSPGAAVVVLEAADAHDLAHIALLPDGTGYLVNDDLEPLSADRTYQLWAVVGDDERVISVGVLGNDPSGAVFRVSGPVRAFVLTEEEAGGVPQSEGRSVAVSPIA